MLVLFIALCAWMLSLAGLGGAVHRLLRVEVRGRPLMPADVLVGFLALGALATLANFFLPLGGRYAGSFLVLGLLCAAIVQMQAGARLALRPLLPHLAFVFAATVLLTHRAAYLDDIGAYQLPNVLWSIAGAVPRGLANLNPRMGFNSEWFVLDAVVRAPRPGAGPSLVTMIGIWGIAWGLWRLLKREAASCRPTILLALFPLVLLTHAMRVGFNAPATDAPVMLAWIAIAAAIVAVDEGAIGPRDAALLTAAIAVFAVMVKVSAAPILLVPLLFAWRVRDRQLALSLLTMAAVVAVPWLLRGIWTSGCAVFPVAATCVPGLSWLPDPGSLVAESENVRNWARMPYWTSEGLASGVWIRAWWVRQFSAVELIGPAMIIACGWLAVRLGALKANLSFATKVLGVAALAQMAFVGVTAPDARFAAGAMWALALAFAAHRLDGASKIPSTSIRLASFAPLMFLVPFALDAATHYSRGIRHVADAPRAFVRAPAIAGPVAARVERFTDGTEVRIPAVGIACWASELPCTARGWFVPATKITRDSRGRITMFARPEAP
jgi:hypothetical protein